MMPFRLPLAIALTFLVLVAACNRGDDEEKTSGDPFGIAVTSTNVQSGLTAEADVMVDQWGIPHIYAGNDRDAWFIQGYKAATDRFAQMDLARHLGQGRIAEIIGEIPAAGWPIAFLMAKDVDLFYRSMFTASNGHLVAEIIEEQLNDERTAILQAYADGVNAYLADVIGGRNNALLPSAYSGLINLDPEDIDPWTVFDTLSILVVSFWSASNSPLESGHMRKFMPNPMSALSG